MPGGDRRGPLGEGPMTGRRAGFCAGSDSPGFANSGFRGMGMGRGLGMGRGNYGRGRGQGYRYYNRGIAVVDAPVPVEPVQTENRELTALKQQVSDLGNELEAIRKLIEDFKT